MTTDHSGGSGHQTQQDVPLTKTAPQVGPEDAAVIGEKNNSNHDRPTGSKIYDVLSYTPPRCRYDPDKPFEFSMTLNIMFAISAGITVANLYYSHPILNKLAADFHVTYEQSSYVPTLAQAGYAAGLLLLCPLGDLVKRRPFVLWLVWFTATMWIGLCVTNDFNAFLAISFVTGMTTVTPQLMLPLIGDLAPVHRRATALSVIVSGLILGMLIARVLSGIVTQYIGWRAIYWISFGLNYLVLIMLYFFMPDYPSTNGSGSMKSVIKGYPSLLFDILKMLTRYPVLVQVCLIGFFTSSTFTSFWTTLTFLLAGEPYNYSSLVIGLFALTLFAGMFFAPTFARLVMDQHEPLFSTIIGEFICLVGILIGTFAGRYAVVGPILQAICTDIGLQTSQTANRSAIYRVAPKGRNRVNTAFMVSVFCGQLMGTAAGNHLYARGGWIASGSASIGFITAAILLCFVRGPHEEGWFGWSGGWDMTAQHHKEAMAQKADVESKAAEESKLTEKSRPGTDTGAFGYEPSADEIDAQNTERSMPAKTG